MEILLIGNGFDLAHGLPTKYRDFLDFCQGIEILFSEDFASRKDYEEKLKRVLEADVSPQFLHICGYAYLDKNNKSYSRSQNTISELHELIHNNTWIQYFSQRAFLLGGNWIDFEAEISAVIQALDALRLNDMQNDFVRTILEAGLGRLRLSHGNVPISDGFIETLNDELSKLIRALEIYIARFVNAISISLTQTNSDIAQLHPDHVLSFNYSNTYERVYGIGKMITYDYIHGRAEPGKNKDSCNLVLGIDEYLQGEEKNTNLRFLTFKKFYQRIYKSTNSQYLEWINIIQATAKPSTLYIFGHSLDITDRDVLQALICCPHMQTKIFYHRKSPDDKQALGKLIHNLLLLLGQEELIRRTSGANRTIEFIPQTIIP